MANIDLTKYGITGTTEIVHNPSYEVLFEEETKASNEGYEVGQNTELDTVNVMTGVFTALPKEDFQMSDVAVSGRFRGCIKPVLLQRIPGCVHWNRRICT